MALHRNVPLDEVNLTCFYNEITTAATGVAPYVTSPINGEVVKLSVTTHAISAGTSTIVTAAVNGTNIVGGTVTIAAGAAGRALETLVDSTGALPVAATARVAEGDNISFTSNYAANDATVPATCAVTIRQTRRK